MDESYILGLAVGTVMAWFAIGIVYNLRRGDQMLRWMQGGLPKVGERTTFRWLGTSVAVLEIAKAKSPFRQLTTLLVLTPRDVPWMWIWARVRGRRDTIIFRGQLAAPPRVDLELVDPLSWTGRTAQQQAAARGWEESSLDGMRILAPKGMDRLSAKTAEHLLPFVREMSPVLWRLSLRREDTQFEIHLPFPDNSRIAPLGYFESLRALARAVDSTP